MMNEKMRNYSQIHQVSRPLQLQVLHLQAQLLKVEEHTRYIVFKANFFEETITKMFRRKSWEKRLKESFKRK